MELNEKEIIHTVLDELIRRGVLRKTDDLKEKTKDLLRNFKRLDLAIKHYKKEIHRLEKSKDSSTGGPKFSSSKFDSIVHSTVDESSLDVINARIRNLEQLIIKIESFKEHVNEIIADKLNKADADILRRVYFDKEDADDIAIELDYDKSTIYRRIGKAVDDIKVELFASDFIDNFS